MKKHLLIICTFFLTSSLIAQSTNQRIYKQVANFGLGLSAFRDLATSPLTYRGVTFAVSPISRWKIDDKKEVFFGLDVHFGASLIAVGGESDISFLIAPAINYSRLYALKKLAKKGWDYKIGGKVDVWTLIRTNPSLGNNTLGFELFPTLFGSFKITKSFERHPFLRKKRSTKKQSFSLSVDVGLWNNTLRNDFAYTNHTPFFNSRDFLRDYEFQWFNGFRIKTAIDYILYSNKNSNAIKIAYKWEGLHSGRTQDRFAIGIGYIQVALLHRLN